MRVLRVFVMLMIAATAVGCSDFYTARRDTISLGGGDALAANQAEQTVDPWPQQSYNPNLAFDGARMQGAIERYKHDCANTPGTQGLITRTQSETQSRSNGNGATVTGGTTIGTTEQGTIPAPGC
jgi:hypothetical protein